MLSLSFQNYLFNLCILPISFCEIYLFCIILISSFYSHLLFCFVYYTTDHTKRSLISQYNYKKKKMKILNIINTIYTCELLEFINKYFDTWALLLIVLYCVKRNRVDGLRKKILYLNVGVQYTYTCVIKKTVFGWNYST